MKDDEVQLNLDWFDKVIANVNGTQMNLFDEPTSITNSGAATISQAASGNIWPYITTSTGSYTLTNDTGWDTWNPKTNSGLHVKGNAEFEGDVKIKGKSIVETLDKIEQRLAILHPNEKLESKWEELKKLGDMYRALEKDIIEKEKIWNTLKK